jgi:acetyl esterase/lipase
MAGTSLAPGAVEDTRCALKWVFRNAKQWNFDTSKIVLTGHSAGGHLASLITLEPKYLRTVDLSPDMVKGVIGISGVYDLDHFARRNWMAEHLMTRAAFGTSRAKRNEASPASHVRSGAPPFLLVNAEDDEKLEEEADELAALLQTTGSRAETAIILGTNHFTILSLVGNGDDTLIDRIVDFIGR